MHAQTVCTRPLFSSPLQNKASTHTTILTTVFGRRLVMNQCRTTKESEKATCATYNSEHMLSLNRFK